MEGDPPRELHGSRNPLDQLPDELFIQILRCSLEDRREWYIYYLLLQKLREVSAFWNNIIVSAPEFWAPVYFSDPPSHTRRVLQRSQNHPLDIVGTRGGTGWSDQWEFIKELIPHIHRWRNVQLSLDPSEVEVVNLGYPAPLLESFDLWCEPGIKTETLFVGPTPRLHNLDLHGVEMPWSAPMMSNLRTLHVYNPQGSTGAIEHVLQGLSGIPSLEHLTLNYKAVQPPSIACHFPRAHLPRLRSLYLFSLPYTSLHTFLDHIVAPNCYNLILDYRDQRQAPRWSELGPRLAPFVAAIKRRMPYANRSRLVASRRYINCDLLEGSEETPIVELHVEGDEERAQEMDHDPELPHVGPIQWLFDIIYPTELQVTLQLAGDFDANDDGINNILQKLPTLDTLNMLSVHSLDIKHRILQALSDPRRCPKLTHLSVNEVFPEEVLTMVKSRYVAGNKETRLPVSLEMLEVPSIRDPIYREIAVIVGEDHLIGYYDDNSVEQEVGELRDEVGLLDLE